MLLIHIKYVICRGFNHPVALGEKYRLKNIYHLRNVSHLYPFGMLVEEIEVD